MSDLLLDISRMREARDRVERTYQPEAFDLGDDVYRLEAPVALELDVLKDKDQFRLVGRLRTRLKLSCARCLEAFGLPLDEPLDVLYLPHSSNAGEGEVEIEDDDLATAYYQHHVIDLGQLMLEQFQLAVPMKPLCRPECRGLCAICGTNLNHATCDCKPVWGDPRLAGLGDLKTEPPPRA